MKIQSASVDPGLLEDDHAAIQTPTVLLAEDEPAIRKIARRALELAGVRVLEASDGVEALRLFELFPGSLDLVITDVVMPDFGGLDLVRCLRDRVPGLKVLFITGYPEEDLPDGATREPGVDWLLKPFSPSALVARVRHLLRPRMAIVASL